MFVVLGGLTHPADVQSSSTLTDITGDLTCVPEHVEIESTICLRYVLYRVCSAQLLVYS
jgi:hypothetical protein